MPASTRDDESLDAIVRDFAEVAALESPDPTAVADLVATVDSEATRSYLRSLGSGAAPGTTLREHLLADDASPLNSLLFGEVSPEAHTGDGFVDFRIGDDAPIAVAVTPLFVHRRDAADEGAGLERTRLDWEAHRDRIERHRTDHEFLLVTNVAEWYVFSSKSPEPITDDPIRLADLSDDLGGRGDLREYLHRLRSRRGRTDLDERLFENLTAWINSLQEVQFHDGVDEVDEIVTLINQFVFVQTLDDYRVVEFRWLQSRWDRHDRRWLESGKGAVVEQFLADVDEWLSTTYGVDLFETPLVDRVVETDENLATLYDAVGRVLGLDDWQARTDGTGITNVDYRAIDEDVLGRAYERYLAEVRRERGIYYTPGYVSEYLVDRTVGTEFDDRARRVRAAVAAADWDRARAAMDAFVATSVLDPACGAGSFLVKAYAEVRDAYEGLAAFLRDRRRAREDRTDGATALDPADRTAVEQLTDLLERLGYEGTDLDTDRRAVASRMVLRHVYGADVDGRAVGVAKLNVWLELITADPDEYGPGDVSEATHVLPNLELNLAHGDSLVGLPESDVRSHLAAEHADALADVLAAREQYLDRPAHATATGRLEDAVRALSGLRDRLDDRFADWVDREGLPASVTETTVPFYWSLQFWHVLGGGEGDGRGFDCVIGNPPWTITGNEDLKTFLEASFDHQRGQPDLYRVFLERAFELTAGRNGLVTPNTWLQIPAAEPLRRLVFESARVEEVAAVPDSAFPGVAQNIVTYTLDRRQPTILRGPGGDGDCDGDGRAATGLEGGDGGREADAGAGTDGTVADASANVGVDDDPRGIAVGTLSGQGTFTRVRTIPRDGIDADDYGVNLYVGIEERAICDAVARRRDDSLAGICRSTTGYQLYHNTLHTAAEIDGQVYHATSERTPAHVPEVQSSALGRYALHRTDERYVDTAAEFYRLPDRAFIEGPKILLREMPSADAAGLVATIDRETRPFPKSVVSVVLRDDRRNVYDLEHVLGLLNSRLLYLESLVKGEKMGQDLFPRISQSQLKRTSVIGTTELTPYVRRMETLATARTRLAHRWRETAESLATGRRRLWDILETDRTRDRTARWTEAVSGVPAAGTGALTDRYDEFLVTGDADANTVAVVGLENASETTLCELRFRSLALAETVYLTVRDRLDSRSTIDCLGDVLRKSEVPVVTPDPATASGAVVRATRRAFVDADNEPLAAGRSAIWIDERLTAGQATLDAAVFDLFGLDRAAAETVLTVLGIRQGVVDATLARFDRLRVERAARTGRALADLAGTALE